MSNDTLKMMKETEKLADRLNKVDILNKSTRKTLKQVRDGLHSLNEKAGLGFKPPPRPMTHLENLLYREKELKSRIWHVRFMILIIGPAFGFVSAFIWDVLIHWPQFSYYGWNVAIFSLVGVALAMSSIYPIMINRIRKELELVETELLLES